MTKIHLVFIISFQSHKISVKHNLNNNNVQQNSKRYRMLKLEPQSTCYFSALEPRAELFEALVLRVETGISKKC